MDETDRYSEDDDRDSLYPRRALLHCVDSLWGSQEKVFDRTRIGQCGGIAHRCRPSFNEVMFN